MVRVALILCGALALATAAAPAKPSIATPSMGRSALATSLVAERAAMPAKASLIGCKLDQVKSMLAGLDLPLLSYFLFWYLGNYYYTISNKKVRFVPTTPLRIDAASLFLMTRALVAS